MRRLALPLLVPLAWPASVAAQTTEPDIVVTGEGLRLPPGTPAYGATLIDRDRLTATASGSVEDALRDVAGFQQFRRSDSRSANPSAQGATLRALGGNAASRTLVLLDGVPIADPFFGYIPFTAIAPDRLAAVRVTKGGGAGSFGAGAVAGTIELVSAGRRDLPPIAGEAFYGSRDAQSLSASVSPTLGASLVTLSGRYERGDGFWTTPADQRVAASVPARYRDWSTAARAVFAVGPTTELQARMLIFDDHRTLRFRDADSRSRGADASIRLVARGRWQFDALAYLQARDFANKVVSATSFRVTLDQRATPSTGIGGKIELRPPIGGAHLLRLGGDARIAEGDAAEDAYGATGLVTTRRVASGRSAVAGLFAEDDWTVGRLVLAGGARVDRWTIAHGFLDERDAAGNMVTAARYPDRAGVEPTVRGGVLLHATPALDLRAAAYLGFRLPTLNELYRSFVVFPVTTQANPDLSPERLRGVEGGVDWRPARGLALHLTAFDNRLADAIANLTIGPNLRRRGNVPAIATRGIEASLAWRRGPLSLDASYAFSAAQVHAPGQPFDGLVPAQSPRHAASATLAWARDGALLSLTARQVGDQYEDDLATNLLPAATTLDGVARLPLTRGVAIIGRIENAFDARVVTRNQSGSIDLGAPRTLWLGLSIAR